MRDVCAPCVRKKSRALSTFFIAKRSKRYWWSLDRIVLTMWFRCTHEASHIIHYVGFIPRHSPAVVFFIMFKCLYRLKVSQRGKIVQLFDLRWHLINLKNKSVFRIKLDLGSLFDRPQRRFFSDVKKINRAEGHLGHTFFDANQVGTKIKLRLLWLIIINFKLPCTYYSRKVLAMML